jgi:hypothetical protein
VAIAAVLGMSATGIAGAVSTSHSSANISLSAHKAKKTTITCYKAKATKKVTAVKPKCPAGWSTKKPVVAKSKTDAFNASYNGDISLLWSSSDVRATALTGTGSGADFGLTSVTGTGSSVASSTTDPINGTGVLKGAGGTLNVKLATGSTATAVGSAAPTTVTVAGTATILSGTGTFAGATGTLKVSGSFNVQSTTAGSSEHDSFSATLKGNVTVK